MTAPAKPATAPAGPAAPRLTLVPGRSAGATRPRVRLLRHEPDPEAGGAPAVAGPRAVPAVPARPAHPGATADLRRRAHRVVCLVLEVLDGRRPPAHLAGHLDPRPLRYVRAASGRAVPSRLTSLHVSRPCAGAVEVAAVHRTGPRSRVLVARLEGHPDDPARWRCVTVRLL